MLKPISAPAHLFPLSRIRLLEGPLKERAEVHRRYLLSVEADRLLAPFRTQAGLPALAEGYGGWEAREIRGHSLGHYLSALALMFASTGDERLRKRLDYVVDQLRRCQEANGDGYVFTVDKGAFEMMCEGRIDASGFNLNGVWVPFYAMHKVVAGLRDAYRYAGSREALEIERRHCDWLAGILDTLDESQIQQMLTCEHGGMNEVLADMAVDTGDERYLDMAARCFHHAKVIDPMLRGEDNLNGLHANTQIPKVVGLAREYELTSEPGYRLAAESFWDNVVNRRSFANGAHSEAEHFFPVEQFPNRLTPQTCETCNTYNTLKLTSHLFAWEPEAARMDFVERALLNHLLVNIGRREGEFGYFLTLGGVGVKVFSTPFDSWWCCVGTGLENPGRYGEQIYFQNEDALWVNLFIGSRLDWAEKGVTLEQQTVFPDEDRVRFRVACSDPVKFELRLRHPQWCEALQVILNGEPLKVDSVPGSYFGIDREWSDGDSLEITLPMWLRLESLPHSEDKIAAVLYGPLVLAAIVPNEPGIKNPASERHSDHLTARGKTDAFPPMLVAPDDEAILAGLRPAGDFAEFRSEGVLKPRDLRFVPFHRIYEEQYTVYFQKLTAEEWESTEMDLRAARDAQIRREAATVDSVAPGYQQPEVEHNLQSEHSSSGDAFDRKFREAHSDGGAAWFAYDLRVEPEQAMALVATYWGDEWWGREFDILVDGEKVATQSLHRNDPGQFLDVTYPIPVELTRGKQRVTVRFQAHEKRRAGRLFGLAMMRVGGN